MHERGLSQYSAEAIESNNSDIKRRLAAILFADIVNYTNRSHENETKALVARKWFNDIVRERGLMRGGRVVKSLGDGALLEFPSAVEAVSCAIEIQEQVQLGMGFDTPDEKIQVRIGVHVGDVVEEDGDVLGDAVNIASRVQGTADPGGICITREVYTHIRPILRLRCKKIATSDKDRLPGSVEVLAIDEKDGATSVTLEVARRRSTSNWKLPAAIGVGVGILALAGLAFGLGWIPRGGPAQSATGTLPAASLPANPAGITVQKTRETKEIPFETKTLTDSSLAQGERKLLVPGKLGKAELEFEVVLKDGKEISREKKSEKVLEAPVTEIAAVGAGAPVASKGTEPTAAAGPISTRTEVSDVPVPFRLVRQTARNLAPGESRVVRTGQRGVKRVTVQITLSGSTVVKKDVIATEWLKKPVDQVVKVGPPKVASRPAASRTSSGKPSANNGSETPQSAPPIRSNPPPKKDPPATTKPAWFCPECGVRWPGSTSVCPNDGAKRPG